MAISNFVKGNLVRWLMVKPPKNTGVVIEAATNNVLVEFDSGEKHNFALPTEVLERMLFEPSDSVQLRSSDLIGVVKKRVKDTPLAIYEVSLPNGQQPKIDESGLRLPVIMDPLELLRRGEIHSARSTNLRITATRLLFDHKFNEFSSLSNSRVEIKPHQVAVLHRVATNYPHRFLLADEVGLGKTIEAGMIIKELKARGLADRVLILAPSGIVGQWQIEMRSKFGLIFSRYNSETVAYLKNNNPNENVWTLNPNVIVSTTYASTDEKRRREITLTGWDLVIIDEAHHARRTLQSESTLKYSETNLYKLAETLAGLDTGATTGLLLLTATPMQLHQFELYALIELLDPVLFPDYQDFETNRVKSKGLNLLVKQIRGWDTLVQKDKKQIASKAATWLSQSEENISSLLCTLVGRNQLVEDLFSLHRLSEVLIRNRKATVGGFMPRVAIIWEVEMTDQEREAYEAVCEYTQSGYADFEKTRDFTLGFLMVTFQKLNSSSSYAIRQSLMRRTEKLSKKVINHSVITEIEEEDLEEKRIGDALGNVIAARGQSPLELEINKLAKIILLLDSIKVDSKTSALMNGLANIAAEDPDAKVLIFTQFRDTQEYLKDHIPSSWKVHLYYGTLKPLEKDEVVKKFHEGTGLQIMISTESGGEGRNFQFCHSMINYDLPWNPMKVEQRIGRLDRIGQKKPVKIINFKLMGTIEERVLEVLDKRIKVFEETIGGLDPILGEVENEIKNIFMRASQEADSAWRKLGEQLEQKVKEAKVAEKQLADLIMDVKSFRQDEIQKLLERRGTLDNRAMKSFVLGVLNELNVEVKKDSKLAGVYELKYHDDFFYEFPKFHKDELPTRVTFDSAVAIDYETVDFLAFGHQLVEALVERVSSQDYQARTSHRVISVNDKPPARGWFFTYLLEYEGTAPRKELFPVFINLNGIPDNELSNWLLERSTLVKREEWENLELPPRDDGFEKAIAYAEKCVLERVTQKREELSIINEKQLNDQRSKLERLYAHKQKAAIDKIESVRQIFERISSSEDPEVKRIIPVWAKNLENAQTHKEKIEKDRESFLRNLETRRDVSTRYQVFTASFIEIVSDVSTSK